MKQITFREINGRPCRKEQGFSIRSHDENRLANETCYAIFHRGETSFVTNEVPDPVSAVGCRLSQMSLLGVSGTVPKNVVDRKNTKINHMWRRPPREGCPPPSETPRNQGFRVKSVSNRNTYFYRFALLNWSKHFSLGGRYFLCVPTVPLSPVSTHRFNPSFRLKKYLASKF